MDLVLKLCFINKVREEHDQIINQFGTGVTRLANHPNLHKYIYICSILPLSSDSFPASLIHPNSSLLIYFYLKLGMGSSLGSGYIPGSEPSPRTARQNMLTIYYQIRCKAELFKE